DLKTFSALGVFGMTAITALTAQNTTGVFGVVEMAPEFVAQQIDVVVTDIGVDAAKTGMLSNAGIIEAVADRIQHHSIPNLVVDPVMIAKSGAPLLRPEAMGALRTILLPLAMVVTPNLHEAQAIAGIEIDTVERMREAARRIRDLGPHVVVVKGGHLQGDAEDIIYDGQAFTSLREARIPTHHTHGTGCIFAAAIAAELALGREVSDAIRRAKVFIGAAIRAALPIGRGYGPANPMHGTVAALQ
ncbi:MAG: bifunctional hydroxymethylpyrimidine kinase/phosphomethylpyrimidine kinase, partial [bacterium]